jgi:hypothetical protein
MAPHKNAHMGANQVMGFMRVIERDKTAGRSERIETLLIDCKGSSMLFIDVRHSISIVQVPEKECDKPG